MTVRTTTAMVMTILRLRMTAVVIWRRRLLR
jgi:hypothetical protein